MKKGYKYYPANVIMGKGEHGKGFFLLGDSNSPTNLQYIKEYQIGAVISIGFETVPKKKYENVKYHYLKLSDKKTQPLIDHLQKICDIIHKERQSHGVLIHCMHGVSRSASFAIAYTIKNKGISFEEAKLFVKQKRSGIDPNQGFVEQLKLYEKSLKKGDG